MTHVPFSRELFIWPIPLADPTIMTSHGSLLDPGSVSLGPLPEESPAFLGYQESSFVAFRQPAKRPSDFRDSVDSMKLVEARYERGLLRPTKPLALRPGERVNLIVVRRPDPDPWNLDRLAKSSTKEDVELAEQGNSLVHPSWKGK